MGHTPSEVDRERDRTAGRTLALLGFGLFPTWIPADAVLAPDQWHWFAAVRLGAMGIFASCAIALIRVRHPAAVAALTVTVLLSATSVIALFAASAPDAALEYGIGISLVSWAGGLALSYAWWRMAALQALILAPFAAVAATGTLEGRDAAYIASYLATSATLCSVASHVRLVGLRQTAEARRALGTAELHAAEERAANLAKSQFLARMSHELRTPLNAILGYAELVADDLSDAAVTAGAEDLARIQRAGTHLLALIDDILDLARIEAGELAIRSELVPIGPLIDDAVAEVASAVRARGITLVASVDPEIGRIGTDPRRLRQIVLNLLVNAIKFTDRGGVTLRAARVAEGVRIVVSDTGAGIPADALPRIFDPFVQADGSTTRRHGGSGLGLAIVRDLARILGGRVEVSSTVGVGSAFTVVVADLPPSSRGESYAEDAA